MENEAIQNEPTVIENLGVYFTFIPQVPNKESERKEASEDFLDLLSKSKSCTGFSNHAVMV